MGLMNGETRSIHSARLPVQTIGCGAGIRKKPVKTELLTLRTTPGIFLDGFQNKITVAAVANTTLPEINEGGRLSTRVAGFGIIRYDKPARKITFECWPRNENFTDPKSKQYEGWPIPISQRDNFNLKETFLLPTLNISKENQVVTVRNSVNREVVSSLRIRGVTYQPKVLEIGSFTIEIGEGDQVKKIYEVNSLARNKKTLEVNIGS